MKPYFKKFVSVLILLCLLFSVISVPAVVAVGTQVPVLEIGTATAAPGAAQVKIPIRLLHNPGISGVKMKLAYDDTRLALEKVDYNRAWGGMPMKPYTLKSPVVLSWFDGEKNYTAADSDFAVLTFRVLDNAPAGDAALTITYDPENIYNIDNVNLNPTVVPGAITVSGSGGEGGGEIDPQPPVEQKPVLEIDTATAAPGAAQVKIPIRLLHNPGISGVKMKLVYDDTRLALEKVDYNRAWGGMPMKPYTLKSPVVLSWFDGEKNYTAADSDFAVLTFRVLDSAPAGDAALTVSYDPENIYNIDNVNLNPTVVPGSVTVSGSGGGGGGEVDPQPPVEQRPVLEIGTATAAPGAAQVKIPIRLLHNPGIAGVKMKLAYDETRLSLEKVDYNRAWGGQSMKPYTLKSPVVLSWFDGGKNYTAADSDFAVLTFRVLDNAAAGDAALTLTYDPENIYNIDNVNLNPTVVPGAVQVRVPPVLEVQSTTPGTVTVAIREDFRQQLTPDFSGFCMAAIYDDSGKMVSVSWQNVTKTTASVTVPCEGGSSTQHLGQIFLLDQEHQPLCEKASYELP